MIALTFIALILLVGAGVLWRELRRAPLLPPGYNADGELIATASPEEQFQVEEKCRQPQEARR